MTNEHGLAARSRRTGAGAPRSRPRRSSPGSCAWPRCAGTATTCSGSRAARATAAGRRSCGSARAARPRTSARPASTSGPASTSTAARPTSRPATWSSSPTSRPAGSSGSAPDRSATPITPEGAVALRRPGAGRAARGRILAVREDHTGPGEAVNTLVAIPLDGAAAADPDAVAVLVDGQRLRRRRPGSRPTGRAWPGSAGTTRTCPGTGRSASSRTSDADGRPGPGAGRGRRRVDVDRAAALGARTDRSSWPPSPASGSACTAGTASGWRR